MIWLEFSYIAYIDLILAFELTLLFGINMLVESETIIVIKFQLDCYLKLLLKNYKKSLL